MPSHTSLHISLNVCHVTSHHPPHPPHPTHTFPHIPTHIPQCLSCYLTPPTHTFPCIPTHIPQCLSCNFTPPTPHRPTSHHPHFPMDPYTYPPMFVMLLHTTHPTQPPHPTHTFPHIPTHIPQCLSCKFTPPTPHQQPTPSHASLPYP